MSIWVWIGVGVAAVAVVLAAVIRSLRPKQYEPVETDFDLRALKRAESESSDAQKQARMREVNKRLDALFEPSAAETPRSSSDTSNQR